MSTPTRYLALDPGERRTGLAATDATGTICVPLERIDHIGLQALPPRVADVVRERATEVVVVGVPFGLGGTTGPQAKKVLAFVERLRKELPDIEIATVDEAHSSDVAHAQLKAAGVKAARRRRYADSLAALEILRRHLGLH